VRVIAVCGEALVDLVPSGGGTYTALPGGSPANTAVALSRLGVPTQLLARLSTDVSGQLLRAHLLANGVDLSRAVAATEPSSIAVVEVAGDGSASYRFLLDGTADWQWTAQELGALAPEVLAGSLALARVPELEAFLRRASCTVSIDPNLRPALLTDLEQTRAAMLRWLDLADLVKASSDDVALLHPGEDPADVARRWAGSGPGLAVVTLAADGAVAAFGDQLVRRPAVPVAVVDTVAAGDTFTAALLAWLHTAGLLGGRLGSLTRDDVERGLDHALGAAAVTCSRAGAEPPWAAEL
jgi:fructokinase